MRQRLSLSRLVSKPKPSRKSQCSEAEAEAEEAGEDSGDELDEETADSESTEIPEAVDYSLTEDCADPECLGATGTASSGALAMESPSTK